MQSILTETKHNEGEESNWENKNHTPWPQAFGFPGLLSSPCCASLLSELLLADGGGWGRHLQP